MTATTGRDGRDEARRRFGKLRSDEPEEPPAAFGDAGRREARRRFNNPSDAVRKATGGDQ